MPKRRAHAWAGATAGGGAPFLRSRGEAGAHQVLETLAGCGGGWLGGLLPDVLEPALSPCHRDSAHSYTALAGVASATLETWRRSCRERAESYRVRCANPALDPATRMLCECLELFWRVAAGFLTGLQAGYVSHLALDALTPSGLPIV
jgi:hypothetical protein